MKWIVAVMAGLVLACGNDTSGDQAMEEMTPEEHARMQAGGTQGAVDSTGQAVRQAVHLSTDQARALGVTYAVVGRETMQRTIRTVGAIQPAEPNVVDITPKIDGFVEKLFVDFTGQAVRKGEPLLTLYSPQLVAAQEELLTAKRLAVQLDSSAGEAWQNAQAMLESSRRRLAYWDITPAQIAQVERTGVVTKTMTLVSPVSGIVLDKRVLEGQQVMSGMQLYRLADLRSVWIEGEVFEQDLQFLRKGIQAHIEVSAYPGEHLMGDVSFVYPTIDAQSRTNRIRVAVPNQGFRLKPGMFATIFFDVTIGRNLLVVPLDAVIVTGERNIVFVVDAEGMLLPREVTLGPRANNRVQILSGLTEGERIVASANFLIDAESRLAPTGGGMPGMQHGAADSTRTRSAPTPEPQHD